MAPTPVSALVKMLKVPEAANAMTPRKIIKAVNRLLLVVAFAGSCFSRTTTFSISSSRLSEMLLVSNKILSPGFKLMS